VSRAYSPFLLRLRRWIWGLWPLAVLAGAWLVAPLRASGEFPGMPCTAAAATVIERFSYLVFFVPAASVSYTHLTLPTKA